MATSKKTVKVSELTKITNTLDDKDILMITDVDKGKMSSKSITMAQLVMYFKENTDVWAAINSQINTDINSQVVPKIDSSVQTKVTQTVNEQVIPKISTEVKTQIEYMEFDCGDSEK